ncbi:MAG TPA: putative metal-binding motif-containing protein [Candidatus Polarisedimenticolia bacterium]|nr:putative metal-binding motif-containing protein [Candidatus Polarisedimenticolia bacterium]
MPVRALIRPSLVLLAVVLLSASLSVRQGFTDPACPTGTELVFNRGDCVAGPDNVKVFRHKSGKLLDTTMCATYPGREYDEITYHNNKVQAMGPAAAAAAAAIPPANSDVGNISVVVDNRATIISQDALGTRIDLVAATKQFFETHADEYDYVFWWPDFNHAEGSFHSLVKNNVQGINVPIQNNGALYATQNLKSLVLYRNYVNFPTDPSARIPGNNDSTLSLMAQEAGHRWAAWVQVDNDPGPRIKASTTLLGRNLAHWCFYTNGPSSTTSTNPTRPGFSSMEGNNWFENPPGTYTTTLKSDGYSKLDQYLLGFRPTGQVGGFFRLDTGNGNVNPACDHAPYTPGVDTPWVRSYPKKNFVVDDIIRIHGARDPDAQTSQKFWRVAFVLLAKQGTTPSAAEISKLDSYRAAWGPYFQDESGGGRMFTTLGPIDMDQDLYYSNNDCDDTDATIHPGQAEVCNAVDDDCDGAIDENFDVDGDGWTTCGGDCRDDLYAVHPGATEIWNGLDDNCDTVVDNVNLVDADADGYFANPANPAQADCNDSNPAVNPGATEIVNTVDDNCNGFIDCADPTVVPQSESGPRGHDGLDNDCVPPIDG